LAAQLDALQAQLADQQTTLKLAEDLEGFLGRLRDTATTASVPERQRVLRLLVKEVLIGPDRVVVRHRIPVTSPDPAPGYLLRGRSRLPAAGQRRAARAGPGVGATRPPPRGARQVRRRLRHPLRNQAAGRAGPPAGGRDPGRAGAAPAPRQDQDRL